MRRCVGVGSVVRFEIELADRRGRCVVGECLVFLGGVSIREGWDVLD